MSAYLDPIGEGRRIVLNKAVVFVGRAADCDVVLTRSRKVSRKHCCLAQVNDHYVLRDLGSMNGVCVNGTRVQNEARLNLGDEVTIGDVRYVLRSAADVPEANNGGGPKNNASGHPRRAITGKPEPPPQASSDEYPIAMPDSGEHFPFEPKLPDSIPLVDSDDSGWGMDSTKRKKHSDPDPDGDWQLEIEE